MNIAYLRYHVCKTFLYSAMHIIINFFVYNDYFSNMHLHERFFIVPDPLITIHDQATPYNGTNFTLAAMIEVDTAQVDTDIMTIVLWSRDNHDGVLLNRLTQTSSSLANLTFRPLTTNSSGNYTLNASVISINSDFILDSNVVTVYNLIVQRAFIKLIITN